MRATRTTLDKGGRLLIPKIVRDELNITSADSIEFFEGEGQITAIKHQPRCSICGNIEHHLFSFKGKNLCSECLDGLIQLAQKTTE